MVPDPVVQPCLSADEAFAQLGVDRTTGYRAIRDGTFPVPVIRVGRLIRVPTAALRRVLGLDNGDEHPDALYDEVTELADPPGTDLSDPGGHESARPPSAPHLIRSGLGPSREGGRL